MNQRERLLAGAILTLVLMFVGYMIVDQMRSAITRRVQQIASVDRELEGQRKVKEQAEKARVEVEQLQSASLPTDRELARALYQRWILELVDANAFEDPSVRVTDRGIQGRHFTLLSFQIDGQCRLEQLVDFLHGFYSSGDLHRISMLNIKPVRDSRLLDVTLAVDAMILPRATRTTVGDIESKYFADASAETIRTSILERNIFSLPNSPPEIADLRDREVPRDRQVSLSAKASDSDELDRLSYHWGNDPPEGARLDSNTGEVTWTPRENGSFQFAIEVEDDGSPRRSDRTEFTLTVVDPPPERVDEGPRDETPKFDEAAHTYLVGTVISGDVKQAWLVIRTSGKLLKLNEGDRVEIGSIDGTIQAIQDRQASIRTDSSELRIMIGQSLLDGARTDVASLSPAGAP